MNKILQRLKVLHNLFITQEINEATLKNKVAQLDIDLCYINFHNDFTNIKQEVLSICTNRRLCS